MVARNFLKKYKISVFKFQSLCFFGAGFAFFGTRLMGFLFAASFTFSTGFFSFTFTAIIALCTGTGSLITGAVL
jgi:hypothetical protein